MTALEGIQCRAVPSLKTCYVCAGVQRDEEAEKKRREEADALAEAQGIAQSINDYLNSRIGYTNQEENAMTATVTAPKAKAARSWVDVTKTVTEKQAVYTVTLNRFEAGYLMEIINAHLAGEIRDLLRPISTALAGAGAVRLYALNNNKLKSNAFNSGYQRPYATVDFEDDGDRTAAGVPAKNAAPSF